MSGYTSSYITSGSCALKEFAQMPKKSAHVMNFDEAKKAYDANRKLARNSDPVTRRVTKNKKQHSVKTSQHNHEQIEKDESISIADIKSFSDFDNYLAESLGKGNLKGTSQYNFTSKQITLCTILGIAYTIGVIILGL